MLMRRVLAGSLLAAMLMLAVTGCHSILGPETGGSNFGTRSDSDGDPKDTSTVNPPPPAQTGITAGFAFRDSLSSGAPAVWISIQNHDAQARTVTYAFTSGDGWAGYPVTETVEIAAHSTVTRDLTLPMPASAASGAHEICCRFTSTGLPAIEHCDDYYLR